MFKVLFLLIGVYLFKRYDCQQIHPEAYKGFMLMAKQRGYPCEKHYVHTEDGWTLEIYRIPHGKNSTRQNKYPIVMVPGSTCVAEIFIVNGENSLAYFFARHGYDVWLINNRGTYRTKHEVLNTSDPKFWDYSLTEMALIDLASTVDYALNYTGRKKVSLVGHSQGSTLIFALQAGKPEYNDKVNLAIHLTPSAYYQGVKSPILVFAKKHYRFIEYLVRDVLKLYSVPSVSDVLEGISELCYTFLPVCARLGFSLDYGGDLVESFDYNIFPLVFNYVPGGVSMKTVFHYLQIMNSGIFRQYDYGPKENLIHYGNTSPPEFDLRKISAPNALFYSNSDMLIPVEGVKIVISLLQKPIPIEHSSDLFRHLAYLGGDFVKAIFPKLLSLLREYRGT